jgi:hypothetical protein
MASQTESTVDRYLQLLDLTYQVAQSLQGKQSANQWMPDCQKLALKLFYHAATIYQLSQGTKAPVPQGGSFFFDHASIAVITRSAVETYLTMFEVFIEPTTDDEFEFRHALWLLSGFKIRKRFTPSDPALQSRMIASQQEIQAMRDRVKNTTLFASLTTKQQKHFLKTDEGVTRDRASLARAAGFNEEFLDLLYAYQSGFVHADGLAAAQIMEADNKEKQGEYIEGHMRIVAILLSKTILNYAQKFPEARAVCGANPDALHWAKVFSGVASRINPKA